MMEYRILTVSVNITMVRKTDIRAESFLALNGDRFFIDDQGELEVIFKVSRVAVTPEIPHGLKYSLVLLNAKGDRVVCFDNAHAASQGSGPSKRRTEQYDHKHVGNRITPYEFKDASTLLRDFWQEVDKRI